MQVRIYCLAIQIVGIIQLSDCLNTTVEKGIELSYNVSFSFCQTFENGIQFFLGISLPKCAMECGLRDHCLAVSYHQGTTACLLLGTTDKHDVKDSRCVYILKHNITLDSILCVGKCNDGMACDVASEQCKHTECAFPNITYGKVLGNNLKIGSKLRYKCDYRVKNDSGRCFNNGTWSHTATCLDIGNCDSAFQLGYKISGVYIIHLKGVENLNVRCDMSSDSGGWIVIQRRMGASDFYKTWKEYKDGFGNLTGNFWIGNDNIWKLTSQGNWKLRIDLTSDNERGYAEYSSFAIGDEQSKYILSVSRFTGNIGDSLVNHNGRPFTTRDRDNDLDIGANCAQVYVGAWWYKNCHKSNLNGDYNNVEYGKGLNWYTWKNYYVSMTTSEMKIKQTA